MNKHNKIINKYNNKIINFVKEINKQCSDEINNVFGNRFDCDKEKCTANIIFDISLFNIIRSLSFNEYVLFMYIINNIDENNDIKLNTFLIKKLLNITDTRGSTAINNLIKRNLIIKDRKNKEIYHLDERIIRKGLDTFYLYSAMVSD